MSEEYLPLENLLSDIVLDSPYMSLKSPQETVDLIARWFMLKGHVENSHPHGHGSCWRGLGQISQVCVWSELAKTSALATGELETSTSCAVMLQQRLQMTLHRENARACIQRFGC